VSTDADEDIAEVDRLALGGGAVPEKLLKGFEPIAGPIFGWLAPT